MRSLQILVLDDNVMITRTMSHLVHMTTNHKLLAVTTLDEGRALVDSEEPIDVIVADYRLAEGHCGAELLEYSREHYPEIKRILVTGLPFHEIKYDTDHFDLVLRKPFTFDQLLEKLKDIPVE